jgi:hypothetical protein
MPWGLHRVGPRTISSSSSFRSAGAGSTDVARSRFRVAASSMIKDSMY